MFVKYVIGMLIGIALNLSIHCFPLGSMDIIMTLILPTHEHSICFHLFVSSLISSVFCNFLSIGLLPTWLGLLLRYFIFLVAIANGIFFLISVSDISLLVYQNAFDFCVQPFCQIRLLG